MQRFKKLDQIKLERQWIIFSLFHPWFKIPDSIPVGRTFARDELDLIYLDHMFHFVNLVEDQRTPVLQKDLPIYYLRDSLLGRRWNQFSQHRDITQAINFWHKFGLWIPHDSFETRMCTPITSLAKVHPRIFDYWTVLKFPAGVPCPPTTVCFLLL